MDQNKLHIWTLSRSVAVILLQEILTLFIIRSFVNSYPKVQSIENQNKPVLTKLTKKYKMVLISSLREYQMSKASTTTFFQHGKVMSAGEKFDTLKNKITYRLVESIFSEHEVSNIILSLKEDCVMVPIDKTANNMAFICKQFYTLTIIKELNIDCHLSKKMMISPIHL